MSSKHVPRRYGSGARRVLDPRTGKALPHPWRARLRAAMDGKPTTKADES